MAGGRVEIFLSPTAFLSIAVAAAEVYPKETIGLLVGLRSEMRIWVEYAVPMQTVERDEEGVEWKRKIEDRIEEFITVSTSLEIVGHFHSHPWCRRALFKGMNKLSHADLRGWDPREIEIVAGLVKNGGLSTRGKRLEWAHLRGGTLQGAIGQYAIKLTGWFSSNQQRKKPKIGYIRCPFATGLDR